MAAYLGVIDEARKKQMSAPGLAGPAKKAAARVGCRAGQPGKIDRREDLRSGTMARNGQSDGGNT